jgi:hypothetical protein
VIRSFTNLPATCFAPDQAYVDVFYERRMAIQKIVCGLPTVLRFTLASRWASTATDGGGLDKRRYINLSYKIDGTAN